MRFRLAIGIIRSILPLVRIDRASGVALRGIVGDIILLNVQLEPASRDTTYQQNLIKTLPRIRKYIETKMIDAQILGEPGTSHR